MEVKEFWRQYEASDKEFKKWEKRADKVLKRYRLETETGKGEVQPSFNILWANTSVLQPSLFSQIPKPDITRRYKDDDPVGAQGSKVLERAISYVLDDGDFYSFGTATVFDVLLPGMSIAKIRYVPTFSKRREAVPISAREELGPDGESQGFRYFHDDGSEVDPSEVRIEGGQALTDVEVEEIVDEHVVIDRWPWKNFRHQKAKRWQDVGWVDYISYLDRDQLVALFGSAGKDIELSVDNSGSELHKDTDFNPTHAEVHEVWYARGRKVYLGVKGIQDKWLKSSPDPLRLKDFYPCPRPIKAVDTNDSLQPIPLFTLYQHQANELDLITKRISILMKALKLAGLYAGSEKELLRKLFESDENQMIPVADWGAIQGAGGISGLVDWLPIEQVGKVLTALFREREQIVTQIFELTGIADIERGSTDPRETKGAQTLKAQFSSRRTLTPRQNVECYFRDVIRIASEIMAEHFSVDTLERMTGLKIPPPVHELLQNELTRQYRIDIETDSTVAPDEQYEQENMAKAMQAVTAYLQAMAPLITSGEIPANAALQLLKVYLRKFKWGREIEETIEQLERMPPPPPKPDPEMQKMQMDAALKQQAQQQKAQLDQQKTAADVEAKRAEVQMEFEEMKAELQKQIVEMRLEMQQSLQDMMAQRDQHVMDMMHSEQAHRQKMIQQQQLADAKELQIRQSKQNRPSA